jgi:hypothetical protein
MQIRNIANALWQSRWPCRVRLHKNARVRSLPCDRLAGTPKFALRLRIFWELRSENLTFPFPTAQLNA